jgi:hypothetical protein
LPAIDDLNDVAGTKCVAGCYRCLLSYYNQPDHLVIDRRDKAARVLLLRLAAVKTQLLAATDTSATVSAQELGSKSYEPSVAVTTQGLMGFSAAKFGLPDPSEIGATVAEVPTIALWRAKRVVLIMNGTSPNPLIDRGLEVVTWSQEPSAQTDSVNRLLSLLH